MGFWDFLRKRDTGRDVAELARRLDTPADKLASIQTAYREFTVPKRGGGVRRILAPQDDLKSLQRQVLRRLLARLPVHAAVTGFRRGQSIINNARPHVKAAVVIRMDIRDFFTATRAGRIHDYFRAIGWNRETAALLTRLCTWRDGLPQGAPTSPALSNLVNYRLDARLTALARRKQATYTRYADDLTFSMAREDSDAAHAIINLTKLVLRDEGYALHQRRKLHIRRRHDRQIVTGLVVNQRLNLPRETRRRLRAIEHRAARGYAVTLTPDQLAGWKALQTMIARAGD